MLQLFGDEISVLINAPLEECGADPKMDRLLDHSRWDSKCNQVAVKVW